MHAFSTRAGGTPRGPAPGLNLGFTPGELRARVAQNRKAFVRALRARGFHLAEVHQIHSTVVYRVARGARGRMEYLPCGYGPPSKGGARLLQGDALVTDEPGILLTVRSADCVPVLLADPEKRAVAAVHAGWKGMLEGIVEKTVGEMRRVFGSRPRALLAAIGPSICACCYEVGEEVESAYCGRYPNGEEFFRKATDEKASLKRNPYPPPFFSSAPSGHGPDRAERPHLDLAAVARFQLRRAGLVPSHIQTGDFCTSCRTELFFSYRKEGSRTGRMMAAIGIRPDDRPRGSFPESVRVAKAGRVSRRIGSALLTSLLQPRRI